MSSTTKRLLTVSPVKQSALHNSRRARVRAYCRNSSAAHAALVARQSRKTAVWKIGIPSVLLDAECVGEDLQLLARRSHDRLDNRRRPLGVSLLQPAHDAVEIGLSGGVAERRSEERCYGKAGVSTFGLKEL